MNDELIQPNLHIAIVHFPIALLVVGVLLETFSFLGWRRSTLRVAARWMILLGAVLSAPTATSGIYALSDVNQGWPIDDEVPYVWLGQATWMIAANPRVNGISGAANGSVGTVGAKTWVAQLSVSR